MKSLDYYNNPLKINFLIIVKKNRSVRKKDQKSILLDPKNEITAETNFFIASDHRYSILKIELHSIEIFGETARHVTPKD